MLCLCIIPLILHSSMVQTGGRGVDHIVEVGGPGTLSKSLECIRMAGWIHIIGFMAGVVSMLKP